jgi:hypothetical protein
MIKTAGRMPAILKYKFLYDKLKRLRRDFRIIERGGVRVCEYVGAWVREFKSLVGVPALAQEVADNRKIVPFPKALRNLPTFIR